MTISPERWLQAQNAERVYWRGSGTQIHRILDELVEHYATVARQTERFMPPKNGLNGIEIGVGCLGIGFLAVYASWHFRQIIGVEPLSIESIMLDDKALEDYARTLQSRVQIVRSMGESLPFESESFDVACCINVLDHTRSPDDILHEIVRVTRRGGMFILGVHTKSLLGRVRWRLLRTLRPGAPLYVAHPHVYSWHSMNAALIAHGWSVLWSNRPSASHRLARRTVMSVWILRKP
jgi:ubiquinone/menaquinone biosynthesis C-methylase UbiE